MLSGSCWKLPDRATECAGQPSVCYAFNVTCAQGQRDLAPAPCGAPSPLLPPCRSVQQHPTAPGVEPVLTPGGKRPAGRPGWRRVPPASGLVPARDRAAGAAGGARGLPGSGWRGLRRNKQGASVRGGLQVRPWFLGQVLTFLRLHASSKPSLMTFIPAVV